MSKISRLELITILTLSVTVTSVRIRLFLVVPLSLLSLIASTLWFRIKELHKVSDHLCYVYTEIYLPFIYLFVFASFSNTPHVFFQVAAFYQIWQACFFHDSLSQLPDLYYPIDISPLCSPTFLVFKENLFNKYNIPYFTEVNLISVLLTLHISVKH